MDSFHNEPEADPTFVLTGYLRDVKNTTARLTRITAKVATGLNIATSF